MVMLAVVQGLHAALVLEQVLHRRGECALS
jgi:hypothetical protein